MNVLALQLKTLTEKQRYCMNEKLCVYKTIGKNELVCSHVVFPVSYTHLDVYKRQPLGNT